MDGTDLHWMLSSSGASEGGAESATGIVDATDNNVFPDVSDASRIAGGSMTRKIFVENTHGTDAYGAHSIWVLVVPTNATGSIGLGFDDADDVDPAMGTLVDFSAGAKVALVSNGSDTRPVDIWGLVGTTPTMETVVLTGTAEVLSVATRRRHRRFGPFKRQTLARDQCLAFLVAEGILTLIAPQAHIIPARPMTVALPEGAS